MHWKLKAAAFQALDLVPFGEDLHFLMQRHLTRSWPRSTSAVTTLIDSAIETLRSFSTHSDTPADKARFLEIGAGRDLAVPIALKLLGAEQVTTVDIRRLAKLELVNQSAKTIADRLNMKLTPFSSWSALKEFGVDYRAPYDIKSDPLFGPFDAFISKSVLEHIPSDDLGHILHATRTFLSQDGLSIHAIDYGDHYARGGGISRFNFLMFEDVEWLPFNSSFQYVNRLRHSEYIALHLRAGLEIIHTETYSEDLPAHVSDNLAGRFSAFDNDDLRILYARIVSRRT